jgi:thiol:disulfide interchange protein DsbC
MKIIKLAVTALLAAFAAVAFADTQPTEEAVKQLIEKRLNDGTKVDSVSKANFLGLYEVRTGADIMYTDEHAKYLIVGHVIDLETRKDYTKERLEEVSKINFSDLPFDSSIKMVKGNGKRVIAVFEDPNCGYCKRLRKTLSTMDNVTVYTFMFNILSDDSSVKSKNVWCSADRVKAWDNWMLRGNAPVTASVSCKITPNDKVLALGKKLHITGTPTIFFTDGSRIPGAVDGAALEEKWLSLQ